MVKRKNNKLVVSTHLSSLTHMYTYLNLGIIEKKQTLKITLVELDYRPTADTSALKKLWPVMS